MARCLRVDAGSLGDWWIGSRVSARKAAAHSSHSSSSSPPLSELLSEPDMEDCAIGVGGFKLLMLLPQALESSKSLKALRKDVKLTLD